MSDTSPIFTFSWRDNALCKGMDTDQFFPVTITSKNKDQVSKLFQLCRTCTVANHCLYEAMINDHDGIWGMTTQRQRRAYIRYVVGKGPKNITLETCNKIIEEIRTTYITPVTSIRRSYKKSKPQPDQQDNTNINKESDV